MERFIVGSIISFKEAIFFVKDLYPKKSKVEPNLGLGNYASIVYVSGDDTYRYCTWGSNPTTSDYKILVDKVSPLFRAIHLSEYE